jgi:hypothetical protein
MFDKEYYKKKIIVGTKYLYTDNAYRDPFDEKYVIIHDVKLGHVLHQQIDRGIAFNKSEESSIFLALYTLVEEE